jgi:hypothetical protein
VPPPALKITEKPVPTAVAEGTAVEVIVSDGVEESVLAFSTTSNRWFTPQAASVGSAKRARAVLAGNGSPRRFATSNALLEEKLGSLDAEYVADG